MRGLSTPPTRTCKDSFYQKYKFFEIEIFIRPNLPITINKQEPCMDATSQHAYPHKTPDRIELNHTANHAHEKKQIIS